MCPAYIVNVEHWPSKSLLPQSEGDDGAEDDSNTCLRRNILFTSCESSLDGSFVSSPPEDHTEITIPFF